MLQRTPFFLEVDQVLGILKTWPDGKAPAINSDRTLAEEVDLLKGQAAVWEDLIPQLLPFNPGVLRYVARQCRSRESAMTRWITSVLGPGRGNGMIGILLSAWASAALWIFIRSLAPAWPASTWIAVIGFSITTLGLIILGVKIILTAHTSGRLLMMADLLDAVIELQQEGKDVASATSPETVEEVAT